MRPSQARLASLSDAEKTQLNDLSKKLQDGVSNDRRNLLHDPEKMREVEVWAGQDPGHKEARLQMLLGCVTECDFDLASLREASVEERRQALGQHAITFAVFEDLLEGPSNSRRNVHLFNALPPVELTRPRERRRYHASSQQGAPLAPFARWALRNPDRNSPVPPGHVRVILHPPNLGQIYDIRADFDRMTVREVVNLATVDYPSFSIEIRLAAGQSGWLGAIADCTLREAGIQMQGELEFWLC